MSVWYATCAPGARPCHPAARFASFPSLPRPTSGPLYGFHGSSICARDLRPPLPLSSKRSGPARLGPAKI
eukprot:11330891-Alexandrium_andersonii.AAC.1